MIEDIVIVGGGFSGTLQAINLLRHAGPRATLIERSPRIGGGLAFGAAHPGHLLNVRAANMSAFPDDPQHFVSWLEAAGVPAAAGQFVPRLTYGRYLRDQLATADALGGDRLRIVEGEVTDVALDPTGGATVHLANGQMVATDAVVLAIGSLPPHSPAGLDIAMLGPDRYHPDPWAPGLADGLTADDTVLILGSGLTMVDVALSLVEGGFAGRMIALSRRGLLPHRHAPTAPFTPLIDRPSTDPAVLLASVRAAAELIGWRGAVDALRPMTQILWRAASDDGRARFLRHLRPWWDIHRHRLAPSIADRVEALIEQGRLQVRAGKLLSFVSNGRDTTVDWRKRTEDAPERMTVRRIVNCTGPQGDLLRSDDPLVRRLLARRLIRPDRARLGIDVTTQAQVIDAAGTPSDRLFAVGPMTRGAFWEIVAVPDIRTQTWELARRLARALSSENGNDQIAKRPKS